MEFNSAISISETVCACVRVCRKMTVTSRRILQRGVDDICTTFTCELLVIEVATRSETELHKRFILIGLQHIHREPLKRRKLGATTTRNNILQQLLISTHNEPLRVCRNVSVDKVNVKGVDVPKPHGKHAVAKL